MGDGSQRTERCVGGAENSLGSCLSLVLSEWKKGHAGVYLCQCCQLCAATSIKWICSVRPSTQRFTSHSG